MESRKKRFFLMTDGVRTRSGFGKFADSILRYLYKTGKYEIFHFAAGTVENPQEEGQFPWKTMAAISPQKLQEIKQNQDPRAFEQIDRMAGYGAYRLAEAMKAAKADVAVFAQDTWGVDFATQHPFFDKITSALHVTIDSRPQPQSVLDLAKRCKHFWCWADFATQYLHKQGLTHVKTVRGTIDTKNFFPLPENEKKALRKKFNIPENDFLSIFVARNQLRKGFPNLLEGFELFKKDNPQVKNFKLLFHTSWQEGWDIPSFIKKFNIPPNEVLTTYVCPVCGEYDVRPFTEPFIDCRFCGVKKETGHGMRTTHPSLGVTDKQLNEIYNLCNINIHPCTSGGLEIPFVIEGKLCGLPGAITNYSCGEDQCNDPTSGTIPLDYDQYLEGTGSNFEKAWTKPYSIAKVMKKFYFMGEKDFKKMGNDAREYVLKNFSIEVIGKQFEDFIDSAPFAHEDAFEEKVAVVNPSYVPDENLDDEKWIESLYKNILGRDPDQGGFEYWKKELSQVKPPEKPQKRQQVLNYFRQVASQELSKNQKVEFGDLLNKNDKGRVLFIQPMSAGDILLCTALFKSIKQRYPDWALYVSTNKEYKSILDGNPYMDGWLEFSPMFENVHFLEGNASTKGYFDIVYSPYWQTQKLINPTHNGIDKIDFNLKYEKHTSNS